MSSQIISGNVVRFEGCGILLLGNSGAGKSDLCLQVIDAGGKLVSDDQTKIRKDNDQLWASCIPHLQGLLEVRGIGILRIPALPNVKLDFVIQLQDFVERLPEAQNWNMLGVSLAIYNVCAKHISSIAILRQLCKLSNQEIQLLPNDEVLLNVAA